LDDEEEESWHEWHEDDAEDDQPRAVCLYCDHSEEKIEPLLEHFKKSHSLDLMEFFDKEKMDLYDRMRFMNFVRKQTFNTPNFRARSGSNPSETRLASIPEKEAWNNEESLVPMFGNDHLLWMLESHWESTKNEKGCLMTDDPTPKAGETVAKAHAEWSQRNTVAEVEAEDWPELTGSVLSEGDLYKTMR